MKDAGHYNDAELLAFKHLINSRIDEVNFSMQSVVALPTANEIKDELLCTGRNYVKELKFALKRIDNRTFGVCRATGSLIPKHLLTERPEITVAVDILT